MHRFFVSPDAIQGAEVAFTEDQAHQIARVLRLEPGDHVAVLDDSGWQREVELTAVAPSRAAGRVISRSLVQSEPRTKVAVYQSVLKANKFELILQKGTELGASSFVPVISERSVIGNLREFNTSKLDRWTRIVVEAAEQSRRGKLPSLQPATLFPQACQNARGFSLIPWEGSQEGTPNRSLREVWREALEQQAGARRPFTVNVFVGPEGGFTPAEVELARSYGIIPVTLGPRILRAETAALAVITMLLYEAGDLG